MIQMNNSFGEYTKDAERPFNAISINVASPEVIRGWSHGEVKNPETINYRSFKPERGGLFCERIFGPQKDWECSCGKYKRVHSKGLVCDKCGVEVTQSKVRRERMGHIELEVPVSHIWFFKTTPSRLGLMLDMTYKDLDSVVYYEKYVVVDPGDTPLRKGQVMDDTEYSTARQDYGDSFIAEMGAPALRTLLEEIDLEKLRGELQMQLEGVKNKQISKKVSGRLRLVEGFIAGQSRPEYMILTVLPVIPAGLRPLDTVAPGSGPLIKSDLTDLYRRVIYRNTRLKGLLQKSAPEVIVRNEKRLLQEAVDSLLANGSHGRVVTNPSNKRPLKSLADMLKGKHGRFRQNLLGKRVDYSGRSVIVVGPELKIHQCGLPKKMALTLFEPFIIRYLKEQGKASTTKAAKKLIEKGGDDVYAILEKVTKGHPIMLNRAPTLHRLSIQAFDPVLIEGSALRLHPLVCTAYNADFDGDQMAVHVPLSNEAQMETKLLMLAPNNIFSPANGNPIVSPTHDIALGSYYLTLDPRDKNNVRLNPEVPEDLAKLQHAKMYRDYFEVLFAMQQGFIGMHEAVRIPNPDYGKETKYGNSTDKFIITTPGRCLFNEIWDKRLGFYNALAKKKNLGSMIFDSYRIAGHDATIKLLDDLKDLGYKHSTLSGISISISDFDVPESKKAIISETQDEVTKLQQQFEAGQLSETERHKKITDLWSATTEKVAVELVKHLESISSCNEVNPVYAMLDSGARGSKDQVRQMAGMRGLMAKPNGDTIERPIISNFREGLSVLEYFLSTHGARKGLADTALKTADSGYMTRRLVDVAQDVICREEDCGTQNGIWVSAIMDDGKPTLPLRDRLIGRFSARDIIDPENPDKKLIEAGKEFTPAIADLVEQRGITRAFIRSALTCETDHGLCVKCYGRNLANDRMTQVGDALGIIAAQSIGEPGTQLTMRTFHTGGAASTNISEALIRAKSAGRVKLEGLRQVINKDGKAQVTNRNGFIILYDAAKAETFVKDELRRQREEAMAIGIPYDEHLDLIVKESIAYAELDRFKIEEGSILERVSKGADGKEVRTMLTDGDDVQKDDVIASWDNDSMLTISEVEGFAVWDGLVEGVTLESKKQQQKIVVVAGSENDNYGTVMEHQSDNHPKILVVDGDKNLLAAYELTAGSLLMVKNGAKVIPGTVVARMPRQSNKNLDITGGLPRIAELFEARAPKEPAFIAEIDGRIAEDRINGKKRIVKIVDDNSGNEKEYNAIPASKKMLVSVGDVVTKGQKLTAGSVVLQDYLRVVGSSELQKLLVDEIQRVYCSQSVKINDKHVEIIIRQMMQKVRIKDPGSSDYLQGEKVNRSDFERVRRECRDRGVRPPEGEPVLLPITKAALESDSFISAASFQDTTRILTDAATMSKTDTLHGFKENVITGRLIPAGTGTALLQSIRLKYNGEELPPEEVPEREDEMEKFARYLEERNNQEFDDRRLFADDIDDSEAYNEPDPDSEEDDAFAKVEEYIEDEGEGGDGNQE